MLLNPNIIKKIGLTEKEATVYELLLEAREATAGELIKKSGYKRATVYTVLESLIKKNLAEESEIAPVTRYKAHHPYILKEIAEDQVRQIETAEKELDAVLPELSHLYQEMHNRPGVKFYEGKEGVWKVMQDTLTAKEEIYSIVDVEAVRKYIKEINEKYVNLRNKKQIKKRLLVVDSEYSRNHFKNTGQHSNVRFIKSTIKPFNTTIQIYDGKIAYITMTDEFLSSMIVNDPFIYSMHKNLFEIIWAQS